MTPITVLDPLISTLYVILFKHYNATQINPAYKAALPGTLVSFASLCYKIH